MVIIVLKKESALQVVLVIATNLPRAQMLTGAQYWTGRTKKINFLLTLRMGCLLLLLRMQSAHLGMVRESQFY